MDLQTIKLEAEGRIASLRELIQENLAYREDASYFSQKVALINVINDLERLVNGIEPIDLVEIDTSVSAGLDMAYLSTQIYNSNPEERTLYIVTVGKLETNDNGDEQIVEERRILLCVEKLFFVTHEYLLDKASTWLSVSKEKLELIDVENIPTP